MIKKNYATNYVRFHFFANGEGELLLIWLLTYFTHTGIQEPVC